MPSPHEPRRPKPTTEPRVVERVQTGVRLEKRLLLVLKAFAASREMSLGSLLEGVVLHAFDGVAPFGAESRATLDALRKVYRLDLTSADSHLLVERPRKRPSRGGAR